jgi:hypothetical protein
LIPRPAASESRAALAEFNPRRTLSDIAIHQDATADVDILFAQTKYLLITQLPMQILFCLRKQNI